jgi:hypothetical protein
MEIIVLAVAVLAAALVMASGVWVATVLIATVARVKPPVTPPVEDQPPKDPTV